MMLQDVLFSRRIHILYRNKLFLLRAHLMVRITKKRVRFNSTPVLFKALIKRDDDCLALQSHICWRIDPGGPIAYSLHSL